MGVRRTFSGKVNILFIIFKLLTISVPSKIILHEQIFVLVSMIILGLRKWSLQWITNFVNYIINIAFNLIKIRTKYTFHSNSFLNVCVLFLCFGMLQVRENEISLRNSSGGPEYLRPLEGTLLTSDDANGRSQNALSFLHYKENSQCYGNNHKKRFVGSKSQVY